MGSSAIALARAAGVRRMSAQFMCLALVLTGTLASRTQGGEPAATSELQRTNSDSEKKQRLLDEISIAYTQNDRQDPVFGHPLGVAEKVLLAIRVSAIYDGQLLSELEKVFGSENFIRPGEDKNLVMIPLDYPIKKRAEKDEKSVKEVSTAGAQWHLICRVNKKSEICDISLRFGSLKTFMWQGVYKPSR